MADDKRPKYGIELIKPGQAVGDKKTGKKTK